MSPGISRDGIYWFFTHENLSPRVTPAFLARQARLLLPMQYAQEHENQWIDGADAITTVGDVDWSMSQGWEETLGQEADFEYETFSDIGLVHDATVIGLGHLEGALICIDRLITLQGTRQTPVQLEAVEDVLLGLDATFRIRRHRIESWQGAGSVQRLERRGLPVEIMTPTMRSNSEEWPMLISALATHTLILPPHARLREELLGLTYTITPTGVKVIDRGSVHQDHAVAVRGVVAGLLGRPAHAPAFVM